MDFERKTPDEIFQNLKNKFNFSSQKSFPFSTKLIIGIFLLIFVLKGAFYTIEPNELGVLLRFGKFIDTTQSGLHLKIPFVDTAIPVKVEKVYTEELGFRTQSSGVRTVYSQKSYDDESLMLTGDLNVIDLEWIVQYKIKDPFKSIFSIRNLKKTLRDISESVMRRIVGDYTFNETITTKRIEINIQAQDEMQEILDSYKTGIQIIKVKLQDVNPPKTVKPAFNEVNQAKQEKEKLINQAWEVYNQQIPQASGEALKLVKEAEGYGLEKINKAEGDAKRFTLLYAEYVNAKDITLKRLYLDAMSSIFAKTGQKYIMDPQEKGILPLLNLKNE